jgi:hypothetical protein
MRPEFDDQTDQELRKSMQKLPQHMPRPGYEQRFWARANSEQAPAIVKQWQWFPVAAMGLGLLLGVVVGQLSEQRADSQSAANSIQELSPASGLMNGSMTESLITSKPRGVDYE